MAISDFDTFSPARASSGAEDAPAANNTIPSPSPPGRKYCVDCKWIKGAPTRARCNHPSVSGASPDRFVAPEFDDKPFACNVRAFGICGEDAKLFEAKDV